MQAAAVSYLKTYQDPLYPYQVKVASHLQDTRFDATLSEQDLALAQCNAEAIHKTLANGNVPYNMETLAAICQIAQQLTIQAPTVINPSENAKYLESSIVLLPFGEGKRIYVVRKGAHIHKNESIKITKAFMLTFDKANHLLGVKHVVRLHIRKNPRQLHCMQQMDARPDLFPENLDYVEYKPDQISVFQDRAGGDLLHYHNETEKLSQASNGLELASQLVEAVQYMHAKNIAHRDLKLDNLLYFGKAKALTSVKISDFEFATTVDDTEANRMRLGTFTWAAPELRYKGNNPLDPIALDTWSLGHILYVFLEGEPAPIHTLFATEYDLQKKIEKNREAFRKLTSLEIEKDKLAMYVEVKLTEFIPPSVPSNKRPAQVIRREAARIFAVLQAVLSLLQEFVQPDFEKQTIVKQLEVKWALVKELFEARRRIQKAGHLANGIKSTPLPFEEKSCKQAIVALMNMVQNAQNGPLELYMQEINLQLENVVRLLASYPIIETNLQIEIDEIEGVNRVLQDKLKIAHQASKSYIDLQRNKPQKEVRSLKDAVLAMLQVDPKSRLDLARVHRLLQDEIKARNKRIVGLTTQCATVSQSSSEPSIAAPDNLLTALFSKVFKACIGGTRS